MEQHNTPMDFGEAVWRTAEIRLKLTMVQERLMALPPFARKFALDAMIADVTKVIKDEDPEYQRVLIQMFRDLGNKP